MKDGPIRCPARIIGVVRGDVFEVKCRSAHCGGGKGKVVLHDFSLVTGELLRTRKFRDATELLTKQKERKR